MSFWTIPDGHTYSPRQDEEGYTLPWCECQWRSTRCALPQLAAEAHKRHVAAVRRVLNDLAKAAETPETLAAKAAEKQRVEDQRKANKRAKIAAKTAATRARKKAIEERVKARHEARSEANRRGHATRRLSAGLPLEPTPEELAERLARKKARRQAWREAHAPMKTTVIK